MPKELNGLSDWNEEEFPCMCVQEDWVVKEAWEGWGPTE